MLTQLLNVLNTFLKTIQSNLKRVYFQTISPICLK